MKKLKFCFYYLQELVIQCMYNVKLSSQKVCHGFNEQEIYGLNNTIADFILPRLKAFKENSHEGHFATKSGQRELTAMIWSFENRLETEQFFTATKDKEGRVIYLVDKPKFNRHQARLAKGFALFGARYQDLFIF